MGIRWAELLQKMARGLVMFLYHVTIKARGWHVMDA